MRAAAVALIVLVAFASCARAQDSLRIRAPGPTEAEQIVEQTLSNAGWVAYIDATRTLAPRDWAHLGDGEGLWMIRPRDPARAAWCADVLSVDTTPTGSRPPWPPFRFRGDGATATVDGQVPL